MIWLIDGNNVMGSIPDGWWNDRPAAMERLAQRVARWCRTVEDDVVLVFDGAPIAAVALVAGGRLRIEFAPRRGRDGADDHIVERANAVVAAAPTDADGSPAVTVVSADRGLQQRLAARVRRIGPRRFLDELDRCEGHERSEGHERREGHERSEGHERREGHERSEGHERRERDGSARRDRDG